MTQFSGQRPKGDAWGVEHIVNKAAHEFMQTGKSPIIPCIVALAIKEVKVEPGEDGRPVYVPVVALRRVEALETLEDLRHAQRMLVEQIARRRGEGSMLPFEIKREIDDMFAGVDLAAVERDAREAAEDEKLTENDRLRRHLTAVHDFSPESLQDATDADVNHEHEHEHNPGTEVSSPEHDPEWLGWTRLDLETAESDADGETPEESARIVDQNLRDMGSAGLSAEDELRRHHDEWASGRMTHPGEDEEDNGDAVEEGR